jgi:hypothetical protein
LAQLAISAVSRSIVANACRPRTRAAEIARTRLPTERRRSRRQLCLPSSGGNTRSSSANPACHKLSPTARSRNIEHLPKSPRSSDPRTSTGRIEPATRIDYFRGK